MTIPETKWPPRKRLLSSEDMDRVSAEIGGEQYHLIQTLGTEYLSLAESEHREKEAYARGRAEMLAEFSLWGTDACMECETGRCTMYVTLKGKCIACHHKAARGETEGK